MSKIKINRLFEWYCFYELSLLFVLLILYYLTFQIPCGGLQVVSYCYDNFIRTVHVATSVFLMSSVFLLGYGFFLIRSEEHKEENI